MHLIHETNLARSCATQAVMDLLDVDLLLEDSEILHNMTTVAIQR